MNANKGNVSRSLFLSFLQRYLVGGLQFISVVVLARLLTPEEIGIYTIGAALMSIAQMFRDFGVGQYLVQEKSLSKEKVANAFGLTILLAWSIGLLVFFGAETIARYYNEPLLSAVIHVTAFNFFVIPFGSMTTPLLKRGMAFGGLLKLGVAVALASTTTVLVLAFLGYGVMSLAWASLCGSVVGAVLGRRRGFPTAFRGSNGAGRRCRCRHSAP
ncbi:MAG: oligosaccharide flippase family protein, partial [Pseudomonadota bacterium]